MKTYKALIKKALADGHHINVWDGEEWQVRKNTCPFAIADAVESVDAAELRIRDKDGHLVAWAWVSSGLDDGEDIINHTDNDYMTAFFKSLT